MRKNKRLCLIIALSVVISVLNNTGFNNLKAAEYIVKNPIIENGLTTWDCVYYGNYWQNDTNGDEVADYKDAKVPIKWRVLSINGNDAFLMSDKILVCKEYSDVSSNWENSTIRKWLNTTFYNDAFSETEKKAITISQVKTEEPKTSYGDEFNSCVTNDSVYLMSISEMCNTAYGFSSSTDRSDTRDFVKGDIIIEWSAITDYAENGYNIQSCWLRNSLKLNGYVAYVDENGGICTTYDGKKEFFLAYDSEEGIRPVIHINLDSNAWKIAGTVNSKGQKGDIIKNSTEKADVNKKADVNISNVDINAPVKPNGIKIKNKQKQSLMVLWKNIADSNGYQIQYSLNRKFMKKTKSKFTDKSKITIKKLKKNKIYYIHIRAYKLVNGTKIYGSWSKVKKVKIKK